MASQGIGEVMDVFARFLVDGDLDPEEGLRLFLAKLFGPSKLIRVGEDEDGQMVVTVSEDDPPDDLDLPEETEARLRDLGFDTRLIQATARAGSVDEYQAMKARLEGRRR